MKKAINIFKNSFLSGRFDKLILKIIGLIKLIFKLALLLNTLSLLAIWFSHSRYYYEISTPTALDFFQILIFYGSFYFLIFIAFPACIILLLLYLLYKFKRKQELEVKTHTRLFILNTFVVVLFMIALFVAQNYR